MHQIVSRLGLHSKPRWVAHSAPDSLAGFCGLLIVERRGVEGRKERRRVRKDERGSGGRGSVLRSDFYLNVTTLRSGLCCRNSVCYLSSVCRSVTLVHPTQGVEPFLQYFFTVVYAGHPVTSVQNFTEIVPGETPHRRR